MNEQIANVYGHKVRVRACGLCWQEGRLLMVNHTAVTTGNFWAPPGGGVEFGQSIEDCLKKEFLDETGLVIRPGEFLFGCEYIAQPLHAIELFYTVQTEGGALIKGSDPELQIITDVRFMTIDEISNISPKELHGIFRLVDSPADLNSLRGFFRI